MKNTYNVSPEYVKELMFELKQLVDSGELKGTDKELYYKIKNILKNYEKYDKINLVIK